MARKSFKDNPAMKFINAPEFRLDRLDLLPDAGLKQEEPAQTDPERREREKSRINLAFTPDEFQYLQTIARQDGLSITEYLNRLISADRKTRVDELKRA